ncbi:MAG: hypothetical protein IIV14_09600 [Bacteroidaceae bacterium]|nr:hypothetical protein [Bacteroidaceae bacterium]
MAKLTYEDLFALVDEMSLGAKDKSRTINKVSNSTVRNLISQESNLAISKGVTASLLAGAAGVGLTSSAIGTIAGAGTGVVATGLSSLGIASITAGAGAVAGGTAGSTVPVIGTIIGAAVGAGVGIFVGKRIKKKNDEKKDRLMQEVLKKQNTIIRDLEIELAELKEKYGDAVAQNERYKYIIGILMANEELKRAA